MIEGIMTSTGITNAPHFVLFSDSKMAGGFCRRASGRWRFVLSTVDGLKRIEASDSEPGTTGERLELLAVVRGLEALEQPSRVTLVTPSDYVRRGLRFGLDEWRGNHWRWERFGRLVPVRDRDLWQRVDCALQYHEIRFCCGRIEGSHGLRASVIRKGFRRWPARLGRRESGMLEPGWRLAVRSLARNAVTTLFWVVACGTLPILRR